MAQLYKTKSAPVQVTSDNPRARRISSFKRIAHALGAIAIGATVICASSMFSYEDLRKDGVISIHNPPTRKEKERAELVLATLVGIIALAAGTKKLLDLQDK